MLARWASVAPDGSFEQAPLAALAYGSTIAERLISYYYTDRMSLKASVIWCLIRHQGPPVDGLQPQILDYASHYTKLMPILSRAFIGPAYARANLARYRSMVASLRAGDQETYLNSLAEMHAVACAQKSYGAWSFMDNMETERRLMGGHAYHAYLGIGRYQADSAVGTTGGGDNNVLVKQTGMYLAKTKNRRSPLTKFLFEEESQKVMLSSLDSLDQLLALLDVRARTAVSQARASRTALTLGNAAHHWHQRNVFASSLELIQSLSGAKQAAPMRVMWRLCIIDHILTIFADLIVDGTVQPAHLAQLRSEHEALCLEVREMRSCWSMLWGFQTRSCATRSLRATGRDMTII